MSLMADFNLYLSADTNHTAIQFYESGINLGEGKVCKCPGLKIGDSTQHILLNQN